MNNLPDLNSHSIIVNCEFALRQQNLKPIFTYIETTEKPYTDSEINDLMSQQLERDKKAGLPEKRIKHHGKLYLKFLREHSKKIGLKKDYPIDLHNIERIIITPKGKGYISTAFLSFMKEFNAPIYFIDGKGMIESCFMPVYFKKPSLVIKQCESKINGKNVEIAKYLIRLKIESQGMKHLIPKLDSAKDIRDILAVEANASRIYFQQWDLPIRFNWKGRFGRISLMYFPFTSILFPQHVLCTSTMRGLAFPFNLDTK